MRKSSLAFVALMLALGACQTASEAPPLVTPSMRPEVTVAAPAATVRSTILSDLLNKGYTIHSDGPDVLVLDKKSDNILVNVLMGSRWNPIVDARITFAFAEINGQTRTVADLAVVTNPGTGFEQVTPVEANDALQKVQEYLTQAAAEITAQAAAQPTPKAVIKK